MLQEVPHLVKHVASQFSAQDVQASLHPKHDPEQVCVHVEVQVLLQLSIAILHPPYTLVNGAVLFPVQVPVQSEPHVFPHSFLHEPFPHVLLQPVVH